MHMGKRCTRVHVRVKLAGERLSTSIIHPQRSNLFFFLTRKLKVPVTDRGDNGQCFFYNAGVSRNETIERESGLYSILYRTRTAHDKVRY